MKNYFPFLLILIIICSFSQIGLATATGNPIYDLNWFMSPSSENLAGNQIIDINEFDESPIVLNDYGDTSEKCGSWQCSSWTAVAPGRYCSGGWNCTQWNGVTCAQYNCTGWTAGTIRRDRWCSGGWSCTQWNGNVCQNWYCLGYSQSGTDDYNYYSSAGWNCTQWNGNQCSVWNSTSWLLYSSSIIDTDVFCLSGWECKEFNGATCKWWNCSQWSSGTSGDTFDKYCSGTINCTQWDGNKCLFWNCTARSNSVAQRDRYCSGSWNCIDWDKTNKVCKAWQCTAWSQTGTNNADAYCSGVYDCTNWIDAQNPFITFISPENKTYNYTNILINVSITDNWGVSWATAEINGTVNITLTNTSNYWYNTTYNFAQGSNTVKIYANDTSGNWNTTNITFFVDSISPQIDFTSPTENSGTIFPRTWISANVSIIEDNLKNFTYNLYNSTHLINSTTFTTYPTMINWTNLPSGIYYYNVTVYDLAKNYNYTETRNITLDTTKPSISFISPTDANGTIKYMNIIYSNVIASDEYGISNITVCIYNSDINCVTSNTSSLYKEFIDLYPGIYYLNATAYDNNGNKGITETRMITIHKIPSGGGGGVIVEYMPETIQKYDIKFILNPSPGYIIIKEDKNIIYANNIKDGDTLSLPPGNFTVEYYSYGNKFTGNITIEGDMVANINMTSTPELQNYFIPAIIFIIAINGAFILGSTTKNIKNNKNNKTMKHIK